MSRRKYSNGIGWPDSPPSASPLPSGNDRIAQIAERNIATVEHAERLDESRQSPSERFAVTVCEFCGSSAFIFLHICWFAVWMGMNSLGFRFDPFPFSLLTLIVSLEAILLTSLLLLGQNRQQRSAERREMLDLQINLLAEQENSKMLAMIEKIMAKLEIPCDDKELHALQEKTEPSAILNSIEQMKLRTPAGEN